MTGRFDRMRPVFTIFDVILWTSIFVGGWAGFIVGSKHFGIFGGIVGTVFGLATGFTLGRLPFWIAWRILGIRRKTTEELKSIFQHDQYFIFHLVLTELMARGIDVSGEKPRVLDLLLSEASDRRRFGWGSLKIAFSELAAKLSGFSPENPTAAQLEQIKKLKQGEEGGAAHR
jgi:hypothetical protein